MPKIVQYGICNLWNRIVFNISSRIYSYRQQKCERSQKFSAENGLPILKNVLLPKTKGFHACLETLGNSLDAGIISFLRHIMMHQMTVLNIIVNMCSLRRLVSDVI